MTDAASDDWWAWDLVEGRAVRWAERGPSEAMLGPYPSRQAAERWRERIEDRNAEWDEADAEWRDDPSREVSDTGD